MLEITACIVAVGVGVWLGSRYLGLDLHAAAYTALNEAEVMDRLPEGWRLAPPPGMEPLSPEEEAVALSAELEELRFEVARLNEEGLDTEATFSVESTANLPPRLLKKRQHTLAFWSQLGGIREEVDRLQDSADDALNTQNVFKVLELRRRAFLYGVKAVKAAMTDDVDPQALQFAEQLAGWYQHGADLYGEAMSVWQTQHLPAEGITSDLLLEQVQQQHDNEALLLFQKSGRLCEVLFRRYQVAFPDIDEHDSRQN